MGISHSQPPQEVQRPAGIPEPDLTIDPFTVPTLEHAAYTPGLKQMLRDVEILGIAENPELARIEYLQQLRGEALQWLEAHWYQGTRRVTAPEVLIDPNGKESLRTQRPDDFAQDTDVERTPMDPEKPYENSPFWHTNIDEGCFPPVAIYKDDHGRFDDEPPLAVAIPNSFPFLDSQELIVFPYTKAVSITQLQRNELEALAALMKNRYTQMIAAGFQHVWFGMHRGRDGGGTLEHLHFQVYGTNIPPRDHDQIWHNELITGLSHYNFQRLNGQLTITTDESRSTETYSPYTGHFPYGMEVAFVSGSKNFGTEIDGDPNFRHFIEMSQKEIADWLESVSAAVEVIEELPIKNRANGLFGYSLSFVVPPMSHTSSPMRFGIHPAKLRSVPFEQFGGLENPVRPDTARDVLAPRFEALGR